MRKLIACILLACTVFCCACEKQKQKEPISLSLFEMPKESPRTVLIYYPAEDNTSVLASPKQITRQSNVSFYYDVMNTLLQETTPSAFNTDVQFRSIMLLQNILYIDLSWQFTKQSIQQQALCLCVLASTFTSFDEIDFVNVTCEGSQLMLDSRPLPLLSSYTKTADILENKSTGGNESVFEIYTSYRVIYLPDESGTYIIPQVKSITSQKSYEKTAKAILNLLKENDSSNRLFPQNSSFVNDPEYDSTKGILTVFLDCDSTDFDFSLGIKAIVASLDSIFPQIKKVQLKTKSASLDFEGASSYFDYIRGSVEVYIPDASRKRITHTSMLVTSMPTSSDMQGFVLEYLGTVNPQLLQDDELINNVTLSGDTLIVDLSASYFESYSSLLPIEEYAVVYSLITTFCRYCGASKVMLLQDGQMRSRFFSAISLESPLYTLPKEYTDSLK